MKPNRMRYGSRSIGKEAAIAKGGYQKGDPDKNPDEQAHVERANGSAREDQREHRQGAGR